MPQNVSLQHLFCGSLICVVPFLTPRILCNCSYNRYKCHS